MKVLVAEDDRTMQKMVEILLSRRNIPCTIVEDGRNAVEAWEHNDYDLIFMDVQMPHLNGLEATRMIRQKESVRGGHTAIIAMTAHVLAHDIRQCFESGMDDYISKPIDFEKLFALIERYA